MSDRYASRLSEASELLVSHEVDALLLSVGADLPYLTGYEAMPLERLTMLVVKPGEQATLVVPRLEAPRVEPGPFQVRPWDETEDPVRIVADLAPASGRIAIGDLTWSRFLLSLQDALPGLTWLAATPLIAEMRVRKDDVELDALRRAGSAADRVADRLAEETFSGRTELELSRWIQEALLDEGCSRAPFAIVAAGENGASPHHEPTDRVIAAGDLVVCDFGGTVDGYQSDTTRTFSVGEPGDEQVTVHSVVAAAQEAATSAVRPGMRCEEIDEVARALISHAGYGEYFIHRTGHGIGLEVHEDPYIVAGDETLLEPGMCFSIEPGIYLPGRFGVRIEDIVTVTVDGAESFNRSDRSLRTVG